MAALIRLAAPLLVALVMPSASLAQTPEPVVEITPAVERWQPIIAEASQRFAIPQAWIAAVMQAESAGLTHWKGRPITSSAGAMGLMQLMPGTWDAMRQRHGLGPNPHDPRDNIMAGTAYLRAMYDRFGYPGLFAAYNAGPGRYAEYLHKQRPLPGETRAYIAQLASTPATPEMPPAMLSGTRLFFPLEGADKTIESSPAPRASEPANSIFVPLNMSWEHRK
jgi:soluble lytic murein transglycosylase-like protein